MQEFFAAILLALAALAAPAASALAAPGETEPYAVPRSAVHDIQTGEGRAYKLYVATPPG